MKLRKIKVLLGVLSLTLLGSFSFADIQSVTCNGQQINGKSCDVCFQGRFYKGSTFDVRDRYYPHGVSKILGTSSSRSIYNLNTNYIIHQGTPDRDDTILVSNYAPSSENYVYSFVNKNFKIINNPASRNDVVGTILYNIYVKNEDPNGMNINTNWIYTNGVEENNNGLSRLSTYVVNLGTNIKKASTQTLEHNECLSIYTAWCGDGVLETQYGEQCDDGNNIDGDGCNANCSIGSVTPTSSGPTSSGPTSSGPTSSGPTSSGPTSSGPTSSGPTSSGPTSSGPTSSGPTGSGPTGSGPTGSGPSGSGGSGSGGSGSGPSGGGGNGSGGGPSSSSGGGGGGTSFSDTPSCGYIDPPSIQIGEYLPMWWKLKSGIWDSTCTGNTAGMYNPNGTVCSFQVANGFGETYNFDTSCFANNWSNLSNGLLSDLGISPSFDGRNNILISANRFHGLGEYVIRLNKVRYQLCDGTSWVVGEYNGTVCEMNFAVTRPYLLQRGTNISTVNNDILNNFFLLNGSRILPTNYLENITISSYSGGSDMNFILSSFISKYEKLALKNSNLSELDLYNLKKVSDKNIYIIDAGGGTVTLKSNASLSEPLTLIVKNGNLKVKNNLNGYGMYIVPNGNVYFESDNCDSRQVVEGLFLAQSFDTNTIINNDLNNSNWCNDGRLEIKGMLKGNQVNNTWEKRRSVLRDFFYVTTIDDRKNKIFEGSSLLIETNTNIWINLPPGANELIDKLQINKK